MSTRTNFKQELMRQHIQEMEKQEQMQSRSSPMLATPAIDLPKLSTIPEVPTNVLKVLKHVHVYISESSYKSLFSEFA